MHICVWEGQMFLTGNKKFLLAAIFFHICRDMVLSSCKNRALKKCTFFYFFFFFTYSPLKIILFKGKYKYFSFSQINYLFYINLKRHFILYLFRSRKQILIPELELDMKAVA